MSLASRDTLEALRARIRILEGAPPVERRRVDTGVAAIDELLGGLPEPGLVEISGPEGSGRSRLVGAVVAKATQAHKAVAWVDPQHRLYPPGLANLGIELAHLLIVRPGEDGSSPWAWATEQLLRSGCFSLVVIDLPPRQGQSRRSLAHTWARSAEYGHCTGLVISPRPTRELPADIRLSVGDHRVFVVRDRGRAPGGAAQVPDWPEDAAPWG